MLRKPKLREGKRNSHLGKWLAKKRVRAGLSCNEVATIGSFTSFKLAERIIPTSTVNQVELGKKVFVDLVLIESLSQALQLTDWEKVELSVLADYSVLAETASEPTPVEFVLNFVINSVYHEHYEVLNQLIHDQASIPFRRHEQLMRSIAIAFKRGSQEYLKELRARNDVSKDTFANFESSETS